MTHTALRIGWLGLSLACAASAIFGSVAAILAIWFAGCWLYGLALRR